MKLQIQVGDFNFAGDSVADILSKVQASFVQKKTQFETAEKKYKAIKKEVSLLEKAIKDLENTNLSQPKSQSSSSIVPPVDPK